MHLICQLLILVTTTKFLLLPALLSPSHRSVICMWLVCLLQTSHCKCAGREFSGKNVLHVCRRCMYLWYCKLIVIYIYQNIVRWFHLYNWVTVLLLLACAKSQMLSASRRQPHLLHVSTVDRRQTWSMDKSWQCVTLSGFLHSHVVRCRWNPISCGTHYSGPGLSENDSAVTTDVCEDQNREVGLWGLPLKWNWPP